MVPKKAYFNQQNFEEGRYHQSSTLHALAGKKDKINCSFCGDDFMQDTVYSRILKSKTRIIEATKDTLVEAKSETIDIGCIEQGDLWCYW